MKCKKCAGEMIQKSRARLFIVGIAMIASITIAFFYNPFWVPGIILVITGAYLVVWATLGKACWCRNCKTFNL
jgi:hypothetical protein